MVSGRVFFAAFEADDFVGSACIAPQRICPVWEERRNCDEKKKRLRAVEAIDVRDFPI
jgi:hypothetical protein